jgi:deoxyribodipyrimidine photo-lyase
MRTAQSPSRCTAPRIMPSPSDDVGLVWLRRDLRWDDHRAFDLAARTCRQLYAVFVFDRDILDALPSRTDRRVAFIHASLQAIDHQLRTLGSGLIVIHGRPIEALPALAAELGASRIVAARDYEPAAVRRDAAVAQALQAEGRRLDLVKDQVIFDTDEVLTGAGKPFSVFTPYKNAWLKRLEMHDSPHTRNAALTPSTHGVQPGQTASLPMSWSAGADVPTTTPNTPYRGLPSLSALGFAAIDIEAILPSGPAGASGLLDRFAQHMARYHEQRDFPALSGTSHLSTALRFGTISIRHLVRTARALSQADPRAATGADTWLSELVWREFYMQILHHHPRVVDRSFRPEYDQIEWECGDTAHTHFSAWTEGQTGYPLVDAAIAQIRRTGAMHNRLRMVVASFLCKDLGIDWRWGERWFADWLNDYDLAANNGGWQWAASTGCDAQPYFRIFNPITQSQKFDPRGQFIRQQLPQLAGFSDKEIHAPWLTSTQAQQRAGCVIGRDYPRPVVDHAAARARTLARYGRIKAPSPD